MDRIMSTSIILLDQNFNVLKSWIWIIPPPPATGWGKKMTWSHNRRKGKKIVKKKYSAANDEFAGCISTLKRIVIELELLRLYFSSNSVINNSFNWLEKQNLGKI